MGPSWGYLGPLDTTTNSWSLRGRLLGAIGRPNSDVCGAILGHPRAVVGPYWDVGLRNVYGHFVSEVWVDILCLKCGLAFVSEMWVGILCPKCGWTFCCRRRSRGRSPCAAAAAAAVADQNRAT